MIPIMQFKNKVYGEISYWEKQPGTEYVKGVRLGLSIVMRLGLEIHEAHVELEKKNDLQTAIKDPIALYLYRAIFRAHRLLSAHDKPAAMQRLSDALAKYKILPLLLLTLLSGCHKKLPLIAIDGTQGTKSMTAFGAGQSNMANMDITVFRDAVHINRAFNQAVGGSSLDEWMPGSAYYANLVQGVKLQNQPVTVVLWWQGEAEALGTPGTNYMTWGQRFTQMVAQFRHDTNSNIRFIVVRLGPALPGYETAWNSIRDQQDALAISNLTVVTIDDIPRNNGVHYDAAAYDTIIHRLANVYEGKE